MAMICQRCGGQMDQSSTTTQNTVLTLLLVGAAVLVSVVVSFTLGIVLGIILGLPLALGGLLLLSRSNRVWRCRACGQCIGRA
jgi:hypothetical protein